MTPEIVTLVLGLCTVGAVVFGIWAWRADRAAARVPEIGLAEVKANAVGLTEANLKRADEIAALQARVMKLEKALKMEDGAPKAAVIPAFMR